MQRDIDQEMDQSLQCFDLVRYGMPLALFIMKQLQMSMADEEAYWKVCE